MGVAGNVGYWNRNRVVVEAGSIPRTQLKWNSGGEHQPSYIHHGEGGCEVSMSTLGVNHLEVLACNCKSKSVLRVWLGGVRYRPPTLLGVNCDGYHQEAGLSWVLYGCGSGV